MCFMEAMRLDPPLPMTNMSKAIEEIRLYNISKPVILPKGTCFQINLAALHRDVTQWKYPDRFIPDRFDPENDHYLTPDGQPRN